MDEHLQHLDPFTSSPTPAPNPLAAAVEYLLTPSPAVFICGLAVVLCVPFLLHWLLTRAIPYTTLPNVLLVGPSGAGKTALLALLERRTPNPAATKADTEGSDAAAVTGDAVLTHTSQTPATVELAVSADGSSPYTEDLDAAGVRARKFLLVDTPGHGKLRHFASARLASLASAGASSASRVRAIVFMVDAAALGSGSGDADASGHDALPTAAAYLYDVLLALQKRTGSGNSSRAPYAVPVLVAANKSDLFTALPASLVRTSLEAELGRIRSTRSRALLDSGVGADEVDRAEEADDWLGKYGSDKFTFAQMREFDVEVDVLGGSVLGGSGGPGGGVDKWWSWIADKI